MDSWCSAVALSRKKLRSPKYCLLTCSLMSSSAISSFKYSVLLPFVLCPAIVLFFNFDLVLYEQLQFSSVEFYFTESFHHCMSFILNSYEEAFVLQARHIESLKLSEVLSITFYRPSLLLLPSLIPSCS